MTDKAHDDILRLARERMNESHSSDQIHRERAEDDLRFVVGDQWDETDRQDRESEGRPCLTVNIMAQNVRQVTGQIRSLNPAIRVAPADSAAKKEVAEIIEGMVRHIENRCDASSIYEAATESAAACSIGFWRVRTDYCDGATFDQEALIERIYNPFSVFIDPFAKHPTRKDARYAFVVEELPVKEFEARYPNARPADVTSDHRLASIEQWGSAEKVVVAEYFWVEHEEYEIVQINGESVRTDQLPPGFPKADPMTGKAFKRRTVREPRVKWAKISAHDVLEGPMDFPCRYIPIVAVTGEEWHLGEETYRSSVIRFAKDPQRLYNYARSTQAEVTALQPKAPYMVSTAQVAGLEDVWGEAGKKNRPYLPYNPDPAAGGAPQRVNPPIASQALMTEIQVASEDIKRTTGIYDASLGARSNETSGRAILARKEESQNATSIYGDNMVKAVQHTGEILVDMIPRIYDARRVVRVLGEDGQEKMAVINDMMMGVDGPVPVNDMSIGKYEVRVAVGPSYSSKREETRAGMEEFFRAYPAAAPLLGDLYAKTLEWTDSDRAAERLRKMLPPGVAEEGDEEMTPEQVQAKQMQAQQAQQQQQMQQAAMALEMREAEAKATKAEADAMKAQAEAQKAQIEVAAMSGEIKALVESSVEQAVATAMLSRPVM
jgi:hypothetical protein